MLGKRIAIIGPGSGGKSTLAFKLGQVTGYPIIHLDAYHHMPSGNWIKRPPEEYLALHDAAITGDTWIMEGNYTNSMSQRFARADTIIKIERGKWGSLWRYLKRCILTTFNLAPRYGRPENIEGEFSWRMVIWILCPQCIDRNIQVKDELRKKLLAQHQDKLIILRSFKEGDALIDALMKDKL